MSVTIAISRGVKGMFAAALLALGGCGGGSDHGGTAEPPPRVAMVTVVAGNVTEPGSADGPGQTARFHRPYGLVFDASGNLYVADHLNGTIRKITPAGQVSTFAGVAHTFGEPLPDPVDGVGSAARLNGTTSLAIDAAGNLYFTDYLRVRKASPSAQVTTLSHWPIVATGWIDGRSTPFFQLGGVAVSGNGDLYATNGIGTRKITASGTTVLEGRDSVDTMGGSAFFVPRGMTTDNSGTVYVYDLQGGISKIGVDGKLTPFLGRPAGIAHVSAMTTDAGGNIYAADFYNKVLLKITPTGAVTTVAGTGANPAQGVRLPVATEGVRGVAVDKSGNIFVTHGHAVIKITPPAP